MHGKYEDSRPSDVNREQQAKHRSRQQEHMSSAADNRRQAADHGKTRMIDGSGSRLQRTSKTRHNETFQCVMMIAWTSGRVRDKRSSHTVHLEKTQEQGAIQQGALPFLYSEGRRRAAGGARYFRGG